MVIVKSSRTREKTVSGGAPLSDADKSLSEQVYAALLQRLLNNELVPGQMLNRRDVAEEFNVSVAPVLEAMLQLELGGFLEGIPRKGTRVRLIRAEDARGQLIVREALECEAARLYAGIRVKGAAPRFQPLAKTLDTFSIDTPERWRMEVEFHRGLVELTQVNALVREFERIMQLNMFFRVNWVLKPRDASTQNSHVTLLKKLATANPDRAEQLVRRHIRESKELLFRDDVSLP